MSTNFLPYIHHLPLNGLLLKDQSVLVPDEIWELRVETVTLHAALEQVYDVAVVGVLGEAQTSAVVHEFLELLRLVLAEFLYGRFFLFLLDICVLFGLGSAWEPLPRQLTLQEVEDYVADGFEIISPRLLVAQVGVQAGVPGGACQIFAIPKWNVLAVGRLVALGQPKVNHIDGILGLLIAAH